MLSALSTLLTTSVNDDNDNINVASGSGNPFDRFAKILSGWQGPISTFGLVAAAVTGVALLVVMMFSGEQMRSRIKKHLVVIIVCVIALLSVSYIVGYANNQGGQIFGQSIVPSVKAYLGTIFPSMF